MKGILGVLFALLMSLSVSAKEVNTKEIKLTSDNTAVLRQAFSSTSVTTLKQDLLALDANLKSGYPIYLVLYTPGGDVQKGLELFEFIKGLNRPVHTVTIFAASMGFQAVQSLGKRYILKYGMLMSHKARGGFSGEFGGGLGQLDSRYGMWLKRIDMLDKVTVARTDGKQTLKSYRAAYENELWLNGPEAVEKGYADAVATVSCDKTLANQSIGQVIDLGFIRFKVNFSGCPIITAPLTVKAELLTNKGYMSTTDFLTKNGKFGKNCSETEKKATKDYYGNDVKGAPAQICAYDKDMTYESLTKKLETQKMMLNKDFRNSIKYSY